MEVITCAMRGRSEGEWHGSAHRQMLEVGGAVSNSITSVLKDFMICEIYD